MGWISVIRVFGDIFDIKGFYIWHLVMAILMCIAWLVLIVLTAVAFWRGEIFLAKEEDVLKDTMITREQAELEKERRRELSRDL